MELLTEAGMNERRKGVAISVTRTSPAMGSRIDLRATTSTTSREREKENQGMAFQEWTTKKEKKNEVDVKWSSRVRSARLNANTKLPLMAMTKSRENTVVIF